jgi:hypothetical protein
MFSNNNTNVNCQINLFHLKPIKIILLLILMKLRIFPYRGINDIVSKSSRKLYDNINEELFQKTGNN